MKRHRFDPFSFLFGAVFLTIGLTVASGASGASAVRPFRSWPAAVIVIGFVLVAWTLSRVLRSAGLLGATPAHADTEHDDGATAELDETPPAP